MKLLRSGKSVFVFQLSPREKQVLLETLELYPLVPASHHRLSNTGSPSESDENQRLLEESLAEQRKENRKQVQAMLEQPERFRETKNGLQFSLKHSEVEWLLQVLNDIRVGSWLALGEPEPGELPEISKQNLRYLMAMEVCGAFESLLLSAFGIAESPDWLE
ncbi:MAG TPA: hypothetical protein VFZ59_05215 [Verrucomicrobiae bacterium]|nr:hypothetical protein [Verrucomicrobiae bacterium]